jgi:hypothetical protein
MKKNSTIAMIAIFSVCLMTLSATAQTAAGSSAGGSASVTPGQASAGASTSQGAQTPAASANVDGSANMNGSANATAKKGSDANGGTSVANSSALTSGTTLEAELAKSLDCKKAKPGDEVTAKLTQDVKQDGKVVVHKGSKLIGHVTEAQAKTKENAESKLGIVFDKAVLKGGQEVAFNGTVQALAPPVRGSLSAASADAGNMDAGPGMTRGSMTGGAGGRPLTGVTSTVGNATSTVGNAAGSVAGSTTGAVGGVANNTAGTAVNGAVNSTSHGVVGMQGLTLNSVSTGSAQGSVITSATQNVKLDAGTQMVLQVVAAK